MTGTMLHNEKYVPWCNTYLSKKQKSKREERDNRGDYWPLDVTTEPLVCVPLQVISCFLYTLYTELYVAGAVVALFVEVNSVTLHLRLMLKLAERQSSTVYQVNKFTNLLTYVAFRLSTQFYLTWYIAHNYSWLNHGTYFLACIMAMNIMILIYFYRLLRADLFVGKKSSARQDGTQNSKKFLTD